ncbi:sugar phosphate nucleotidyltransferase [Shewanella surugensis]|uniref:sugar phosphate nucleotidyltransferase n=1 Tax=Shewanella surugensis TaxID=212020 RepID=UPI0028A1CFCD|nr:sugar phosphate nucleotidyltransferase [Shewanella surugensis]
MVITVSDPEHYGVAEIDQCHRVIAIDEKPKQPKSNVAITGLYCYDNRVIEFAKQVKPSKRGELEITSINQMYLEREELTLELLSPDISWFDMGTHEKLNSASLFIKQVEDKIGKSLVCLDEIVKTNTGFDYIATNSEQERLDPNMTHLKDETRLILESRLLAVKSHKPIQNKVSMCEY